MVVERGKILDLWDDDFGTVNWLYFLIDPRTNDICYVGVTWQNPKNRFRQHRSPKPSNKTAIAKLQRYLKENNMTLGAEIVAKGSEEAISLLEEQTINHYRKFFGVDYLKNHQSGGRDNYKCASESIKKAWKSQQEGIRNGSIVSLKGEENPTSKLTEQQVLKIYDLINKFYTNTEIITELSLPIGVTGMAAIRKGSNWNHTFEREGMINIPSMNVVKGALNSREKIEVLKLIEKGIDFKEIQKKYKVQYTDLTRIKEKTLWKMAWNVYENYYKQLNK